MDREKSAKARLHHRGKVVDPVAGFVVAPTANVADECRKVPDVSAPRLGRVTCERCHHGCGIVEGGPFHGQGGACACPEFRAACTRERECPDRSGVRDSIRG